MVELESSLVPRGLKDTNYSLLLKQLARDEILKHQPITGIILVNFSVISKLTFSLQSQYFFILNV